MSEQQSAPRDLERLFARGLLTRAQFVAGLAALGVGGTGISYLLGSNAPQIDAQSVAKPKYLAIIVLDAFRADYLSLQRMPALEALAKSGVRYERAWVGQLESETPAGHATIAMGSMPRNDGIIGFEWRDPITGKERLDGWPPGVIAGQMERDLRASGASSIPSVVKAAHPKARIVTVSSEKVYAAGALGGWAADYILYHQRVGPKPNQQLVLRALTDHAPPASFLRNPAIQGRLPMKHFTDWDYLSTMTALAALRAFRPTVLMVNLPGADVYGHPYGGTASPNVTRQVIAGADRNIARIVQAYKQAGIYNQTLFVVTSDHGMVPNNRTVDGSTTKAIVRDAGGKYLFHTGGTAADIYVTDRAAAPAVATAMARNPNVAGSYHLDPASLVYELASGTTIDPALDTANRYLLSTFAGPTAPDVVAAFRENTIGTSSKTARGDHGGLNWGAQQVPLILSGPGVPNGVVSQRPARLMDVAPTVLRVMGLPPGRMDGVVLADSVQAATAQEVAMQVQLSALLTPYQDALIAQSTDNLEEDRRTGRRPPPAARAVA